ncbi:MULTISPECIES: LysE family transporter [Rhodomicrobium]|uniref:LysE family translocator n=1 Tax=Rhodomicrobium TaxID=1068 RepID=UPI000B4B9F69|nr:MULTISPECIES: LysE family transporter [Rhodomicrobium]
MLIKTWLLFMAVAILPVLSPGPGMLLAISNALRYGPQATFYSALGNSIGLTALGLFIAFGLAAILEVSAAAFTIIKIIGAAYLAYLGIKLWIDGKAISLPGDVVPVMSRAKLFRQAFFLSITNPKALVLMAALFPPFIDRAEPLFAQAVIMSLTYAAMCFANHLMLAFAGGKIRRFLSSEKRITTVRRALGTLFIAFGAALATASR